MNVKETEVMKMLRHPSPVKNMIDQKQPENMDYLNSLGSMITGDARCTREIKSRITLAKQHSPRRKLFLQVKLDLSLRKKLLNGYILSIALYSAETWTPREVDQKHPESSEMCCSRRMERISWTDRVRNEEALHRGKEERNILQTIERKKANWIGHILRWNCLLQHAIEGKRDVTGRQGRKREQLLDAFK